MSRIGYTVTAGGESRTVILPQDYPPEEAARQVALARAAEAGANLSGLHAMRPPRPSTTHWFVVPDEGEAEPRALAADNDDEGWTPPSREA